MQSSTAAALMVFVSSGAVLGVVTWREHQREEAQRLRSEADFRSAADGAAAEARRAEDDERRRFLAMSDTGHLTAARGAIAAGQFEDARRHLTAVTRDAGVEADRLLADISRREQRAQRDAERAQREAADNRRQDAAISLDRALLAIGHDVDRVEVDGTTVRIRYALCSRVFVEREVGGLSDLLRQQGFTRVECRGGRRTVRMDL